MKSTSYFSVPSDCIAIYGCGNLDNDHDQGKIQKLQERARCDYSIEAFITSSSDIRKDLKELRKVKKIR